MRRRLVVVVALAGTAVAACGGSGGTSRPKLVAQRSTTTAATSAPSTTVAGSAASPPAGASGKASSAGPSTTAASGGPAGPTAVTPPQGPGPERPVTATLDRPCVHRGSPAEMQGFTAHLAARAAIGYDTIYSDNSNELMNPSYKTGYGYGKSDDSGTYHASWIVPATAPPGTAKLYVLYAGNKPAIELPFTIVTETGKCP